LRQPLVRVMCAFSWLFVICKCSLYNQSFFCEEPCCQFQQYRVQISARPEISVLSKLHVPLRNMPKARCSLKWERRRWCAPPPWRRKFPLFYGTRGKDG